MTTDDRFRLTALTVADLDPQIAPVVADFGRVALSADTLPAFRTAAPPTPTPAGMSRSEHSAPGSPQVRLRVHRPLGSSDLQPCIYRMHGGGFVLGSYDMDDDVFDRWCPELGVVGVSVDYRLAPEVPYPGALEDCYQGLRWVHENAAALGIDAARVGVAGISAGGGLAAALALLARDRGEVPVHFQLLDSPMLDDRQQSLSSQLDGLAVWSRESNTFGWQSYLGALYGKPGVPYTAAPGRCDDLSGLPPAFVSVGGADGFRDDDVRYALRLSQAGVPCELHVYACAPHGYYLAAESDTARRSQRDTVEWLRRQLAREPKSKADVSSGHH